MSSQVNNKNLQNQINNNVPLVSEQPMFSSDPNEPNRSENVVLPFPPLRQPHFMTEQAGEVQGDATPQNTNAPPEPAYEPMNCSCSTPACQARRNRMYNDSVCNTHKPLESQTKASFQGATFQEATMQDATVQGATEQNVVQQEPVYQATNSLVFLPAPGQEQPGYVTVFRPDIPTSSAQGLQEQPQSPQGQEQPTVMPVISQQVAFVAQPSTLYVASPTFVTIPVIQQAVGQQGMIIPRQALSPGQQILVQPVIQLPQGVVPYGLAQLGGDKIPAAATQQTEEPSEEVDEQYGEVNEQSGEFNEQFGEFNEQSEQDNEPSDDVDERSEISEPVPELLSEPAPQDGKRVVRNARTVSFYRLSSSQDGEYSNMSRRNYETHRSHQQHQRNAASANRDQQDGFEDYEEFDERNYSICSLKVTINNNRRTVSESRFQKHD